MGQFTWIVKFALRMFTFMTHCGENKLWQQQNIVFAINTHRFCRTLSSRAVRISSRAVRVFPALSLRRVRPSYGTFSLMVLQGNCARGRTGHMISNGNRTERSLACENSRPSSLLGPVSRRSRKVFAPGKP